MNLAATEALLAALLFFAPCAAAKQLFTGRYYAEKRQYLVGEPIIVDFEIVNHGHKAGEIGESSCVRPGPGPFDVDDATRKKKAAPFGCGPIGFAGSCLIGASEIPAGGKYIKRMFLNGPFLLNFPRTYHVHAMSEEDLHRWDGRAVLAHLHAESEFEVTLRTPHEGELEAAYKPFFDDLKSEDATVRYFAASTIAQNPPLFAEELISALADDPITATLKREGLGRLGTPTARAELIAMASTGPGEFRQPAIQALGELGNPSDCRALLFIGSQNKDYTRGEIGRAHV